MSRPSSHPHPLCSKHRVRSYCPASSCTQIRTPSLGSHQGLYWRTVLPPPFLLVYSLSSKLQFQLLPFHLKPHSSQLQFQPLQLLSWGAGLGKYQLCLPWVTPWGMNKACPRIPLPGCCQGVDHSSLPVWDREVFLLALSWVNVDPNSHNTITHLLGSQSTTGFFQLSYPSWNLKKTQTTYFFFPLLSPSTDLFLSFFFFSFHAVVTLWEKCGCRKSRSQWLDQLPQLSGKALFQPLHSPSGNTSPQHLRL